MSLPMQPCIDPNPDIAGIGVRVSIYAQVLLSLVPAALFISDGKITANEADALETISANILLTACALLVSAFVQAATFGLSVYHAIIVLNLSWINNMGAFGCVIVEKQRQVEEKEHMTKKERLLAWWFHSDGSHRFRWPIATAAIHLTAMSAFGIWVWAKIDDFGNQPQCTPQTFITILGRDIFVAHRSIRLASVVIYAAFLIPFVNVILMLICLALIYMVVITLAACCMLMFRKDSDHKERLFLFSMLWLVGVILVVVFVVDTELMVQKSSPLVKSGESQWTFGQTLAILMLVLPLTDVMKQSLEWYKASREEKGNKKQTEEDDKDGNKAGEKKKEEEVEKTGEKTHKRREEGG